MKKRCLCLAMAVLFLLSGAVAIPTAAQTAVTVTGGTVTAITGTAGLPAKSDLLAGLTPYMGDTSKTVSVDNGTVYAGDIAALTDGNVQGIHVTATTETVNASSVSVATVNNQWNTSSDGWGAEVWMVFDMGEEKTVSSVLIANQLLGTLGTGSVSARNISKGEIYVGATRSAAVDAAARVLTFDGTSMRDSMPAVMLLSLTASVKGRYVGFHFTLPDEALMSETGAHDGDGHYRYKTARLSELAVYAADAAPTTASAVTATGGTVTTVTSKDALPKTDNLASGIVPLTGDNSAPISTDNGMVYAGSAAALTDGKVQGLDVIATDQTVNDSAVSVCTVNNQWNSSSDGWGNHIWLVFDLGESKEITHVMIANRVIGELTAQNLSSCNIYKGEIYVGGSRQNAVDPSAKVLSFDCKDGHSAVPAVLLFAFEEEKNGQYVAIHLELPNEVAFSETGANDGSGNYRYKTARLSEIGIYDVPPPEPEGTVNLIAGKIPSEDYLCEPNRPDIYNDPDSYLCDPSWDEARETLTDGDLETRSAWTVKAPGRFPTVADRYYIQPTTPWSVLIYHLGGTAAVSSIRLTSTHEWGNYFVGGVDYYVGQTLATLFQKENLVFTTHGEKTVEVTEDGEKVTKLDPDTDVLTREINCRLTTPKEGRYAAIVVTRPTASTKLGYSIARIDEIAVRGVLPPDKAEILPQTTFTDPATGCTMTVAQKNFDDVDFFGTIGGLKITKSPLPATMDPIVESNWLKVNSDVYHFVLTDKSGREMTAADLDGRGVKLTVPNTAAYEQGLGEIIGGEVKRVLNSRVVDGNILGNNITCYPTDVVCLIFDDSGVIRSGVAGSDVYTGEVKGVQDDAGNALRWLWLLLPAAVIAAVTVAVLRRVRRERRCR